jgi:hypothetical protein
MECRQAGGQAKRGYKTGRADAEAETVCKHLDLLLRESGPSKCPFPHLGLQFDHGVSVWWHAGKATYWSDNLLVPYRHTDWPRLGPYS